MTPPLRLRRRWGVAAVLAGGVLGPAVAIRLNTRAAAVDEVDEEDLFDLDGADMLTGDMLNEGGGDDDDDFYSGEGYYDDRDDFYEALAEGGLEELLSAIGLTGGDGDLSDTDLAALLDQLGLDSAFADYDGDFLDADGEAPSLTLKNSQPAGDEIQDDGAAPDL